MPYACFASFAVLLTTSAPPEPTAATTVAWTEHVAGDSIARRLNVAHGAEGASAFVRLIFSSSGQGETWSTSREDHFRDQAQSEWKLAIPIAVAGEKRPQVLAKLYRPNWLDFIIFTLSDDGIRRGFEFSCRDEGAIKWHTQDRRLVSFESFDKFEPVPQRLQATHRIGYPWRLHRWYKFDRHSATWQKVKQQWERYRFDAPSPGQVISTPQACHFLFPSSPSS